jgi:hypothetical protein
LDVSRVGAGRNAITFEEDVHMQRTWAQRLLLVILVLLPIGAIAGQTTGRSLTPGTPVTGTLDSSAIVQVYTLDAEARQTIDLVVQNTLGVPLSMRIPTAKNSSVSPSPRPGRTMSRCSRRAASRRSAVSVSP